MSESQLILQLLTDESTHMMAISPHSWDMIDRLEERGHLHISANKMPLLQKHFLGSISIDYIDFQFISAALCTQWNIIDMLP